MRAVQHLAARGHQRIGFLGDVRTIWTAEERYLGYIEGLASCGLRLEAELVQRDVSGAERAQVAATTMLRLDSPPTAIFTAQNLLTQGAIRALRVLGLHHQIALIGFDDFPLAELLDPPVSIVAQNPHLLGLTAAGRLFERLDGDESAAQHVIVPTQLIARGSGEIPASN
jgi:LacI family transcriptional regulator